jgi:lipid-A-disaccharide synthase
MNLPAMLGAVERLGAEFEFVMPVASTLDTEWVREQIEAEVSKFQSFKVSRLQEQGQRQGQDQSQLPHPSQQRVRMGHPGAFSPVEIHLTDDARASLLHARVGVVASGTATVEAALIGTPFVMVYRVAGLTWALGRHLVSLPHYGMVNLVAGREVVPELIQDDFTPAKVEREVRVLLEEGGARRKMTEALAEVRGLLRCETGSAAKSVYEQGVDRETAAQRAAKAVLRVAEESVRKPE